MNFHFLKYLKIAALMSVASLTFIGCGDDDVAKPDSGSSSSSVAPIMSSVAETKISPIKINDFGVTQVTASRFNVMGNVIIDYTDTTVINVDSVKVTDIQMNVGLVQGNDLGNVGATVKYITDPTFPTERVVNFSELGAYIDVNSFSACGDFIVEVVVYSSSPDNKNKYISKKTASFSKPAATYCPDPLSSSSSEQASLIEMDSYAVTLTTSKTSGNVAIDFETGNVYPYSALAANKATIDAVFVWENGEGFLKSPLVTGQDNYDVLLGGNDTKFAEINNIDKILETATDIYLPAPVYTNIFSYGTPSITAIDELAYGVYYVAHTSSYNAETKDGFIVLLFGQENKGSNGSSIELTVYKKK